MPANNKIYIYGRKPVEEILLNHPNEIDKIFLRSSLNLSSLPVIQELVEKNGIPVSKVPGQKIYTLVGRVNDQGIVAQKSEISYKNFNDWVQNVYLNENPAVLLLNGIEDPHNFGAILRSAAAAGISAVIVPMQNQAPVNAVVMKTSAGTAGRIPIIRVQDVNQGFKDLQNTGFKIVALDAKAEKTIWELNMEEPVAFLIGSEGSGIDNSILNKCNYIAKLPLANHVESLNASVMAGIICFEWKKRKG